MKGQSILYLGIIVILGMMIFPNSYVENVEANPGFYDEVGTLQCNEQRICIRWWASYNIHGVHIFTYPSTVVVDWGLRDHRELNETPESGHGAYSGEFIFEDMDQTCTPSQDRYDFNVGENEVIDEEGELHLTWDEKPDADHAHVQFSVRVDEGSPEHGSKLLTVYFHDGEAR